MKKHWDIDIALFFIFLLTVYLFAKEPSIPVGVVIVLALYCLIRRTKG